MQSAIFNQEDLLQSGSFKGSAALVPAASARPGERNCEEGARVVVGRRVALVVGGVALVVGACCTAACSTVPLKICFMKICF